MTLELSVSFQVAAFGDTPVFAAIAPGTLADIREESRRAVVPGGGPESITSTTRVHGEEIREVASRGEWHLKPFSSMWQTVMSVTDTTRTVEDAYVFLIKW